MSSGLHDSDSLELVSFEERLRELGFKLTRDKTELLQINIGLKCSLSCLHCHVESSASRVEQISVEVVDEIISYLKRSDFKVVDITGGAPELSEHLKRLIEGVRPLVDKVMLRSNLVLLGRKPYSELVKFFKDNDLVVIGSLPSLSKNQTDAQRGDGVFDAAIEGIKKLNEFGYGTDLELNLASNPSGAFLVPSQSELEKRYKDELARRYDIKFNNLFVFANVPIGRFKGWLRDRSSYSDYYKRLISSFNEEALKGVMCRNQVSVAWDGSMYDCDFHLAAGIPLGGNPVAICVSDMKSAPKAGSGIALSDHCYTCVAGGGFGCGGSIE